MPKHIQVSPDEDLGAFYGGGGRTHIPDDLPGSPFAMEIDDPESEESQATPPVGSEPASPPTPAPPVGDPPVAAPPPVPPPPTPSPRSTAVQLTPYTGPSPIVAALLSLFLPGVGQIMAGQTTKGAVFLVLALCTGCGGGLFNIVLALDAYAIAKRRTNNEPVADWQFF